MRGYVKQLRALTLVAAASLALAACQTAGLKPGSIQTSFPPAGWNTERKGNEIAYVCSPNTCRTKQAVFVSPIKVKGDAEAAVRSDIFSAGLMRELGKSLNRASKGGIQTLSTQKVTTSAYSGFDFVYRITPNFGEPQYLAARFIIQADRGVAIGSISPSRQTAQANLRKYLASTTVRRLP
ncbi:hypothetical protein JM93_01450 [Roseibium hamelinense]|uniref:Uncharacterized protein n=1 Tax=Roseibium hamelinense TaxID=150831 RepID=A0A562TB12_9HYPH|nr:hypothetical protein [Roseibium hamelinense]MTI45171.1 hypothetical protein [Roseibium hamelinense]TWI90468.1 hypothetical protein JM93_01450 [Roseibium hamelinense]